MKRVILGFVVGLFLAVAVWAQTPVFYPTYYQEQAGRALGGEHTPLVWIGSDTISSTANFGAYATGWMQIGYSPNATAAANATVFPFNPQIFTVSIQKVHAFATAEDSCYLSSARFEIADSATAVVPFWNSDSSNLFIATTNYSRVDYGSWTFLPDTITTMRYIYPLKVQQGAYIRLVFSTVAQD